MLNFLPLSFFFTRVILSLIISSLFVFIYLPSNLRFNSVVFQDGLAQVTDSSLLISKNDGLSVQYDINDYKNGFGHINDSNYVLSCNDAQKTLGTGNYYLSVKTGEFNDYIIPYDPNSGSAASLCDTLTKNLVSHYLVSNIKPDINEFNGEAFIVSKPGLTSIFLGGSVFLFPGNLPGDIRFTITRWGRIEKQDNEYGACCFNTTKEAFMSPMGSWGKAFTITGHKLNGSFLYLTKAVFANYVGTDKYAIKGKVNDLYLNSHGAFNCSWTITLNYANTTLNSKLFKFETCEFDAKKIVAFLPTSATFLCVITSIPVMTFWPSVTDQTKTITVQIENIASTTTFSTLTTSIVPKRFCLDYYYLNCRNYGTALFLSIFILSLSLFFVF